MAINAAQRDDCPDRGTIDAGRPRCIAHGPCATRGCEAAVLLARGCTHLLITLGAQGVLHTHAGGMQHHPAPVVEAVDSTAAGDTFIGGFAARLAAGASAAEAIRFGQAAAAVSVTRHRAQTSIPTLRDVSAA